MNTRPVTEDGKHEPHTGWYCYYVYGKGGIGYYEPKYVYEPEWITIDGNTVAEYIVAKYEYEFFGWASAPVLDVFCNVTPPQNAIEDLITEQRIIIAHAEEQIALYEKFLN